MIIGELLGVCRLCRGKIFGLNRNQVYDHLVAHLMGKHDIDDIEAKRLADKWVGSES